MGVGGSSGPGGGADAQLERVFAAGLDAAPIPMVCCHLKYLRFVAEKVNTDVFGKDSPFSEWNQRNVVLKGLPAFEVNGDVVKYGDDDCTVIGVFKRHKIPCGWRE